MLLPPSYFGGYHHHNTTVNKLGSYSSSTHFSILVANKVSSFCWRNAAYASYFVHCAPLRHYLRFRNCGFFSLAGFKANLIYFVWFGGDICKYINIDEWYKPITDDITDIRIFFKGFFKLPYLLWVLKQWMHIFAFWYLHI